MHGPTSRRRREFYGNSCASARARSENWPHWYGKLAISVEVVCQIVWLLARPATEILLWSTRYPQTFFNELELEFALAEYIFYLSLLILNDREFSISYGDIRGYSSLIIVISIVKCIKIEILEVIYYRIVDFIKAFNGILRKEAGDICKDHAGKDMHKETETNYRGALAGCIARRRFKPSRNRCACSNLNGRRGPRYSLEFELVTRSPRWKYSFREQISATKMMTQEPTWTSQVK